MVFDGDLQCFADGRRRRSRRANQDERMKLQRQENAAVP